MSNRSSRLKRALWRSERVAIRRKRAVTYNSLLNAMMYGGAVTSESGQFEGRASVIGVHTPTSTVHYPYGYIGCMVVGPRQFIVRTRRGDEMCCTQESLGLVGGLDYEFWKARLKR